MYIFFPLAIYHFQKSERKNSLFVKKNICCSINLTFFFLTTDTVTYVGLFEIGDTLLVYKWVKLFINHQSCLEIARWFCYYNLVNTKTKQIKKKFPFFARQHETSHFCVCREFFRQTKVTRPRGNYVESARSLEPFRPWKVLVEKSANSDTSECVTNLACQSEMIISSYFWALLNRVVFLRHLGLYKKLAWAHKQITITKLN